MLLKRNLYFIFVISLLVFYFLFMFPSCTSLIVPEAVIESGPESPENNDTLQRPEISILQRPEIQEQSPGDEPFVMNTLPLLQPPESIYSYISFELKSPDPLHSILLSPPELVLPSVQKKIPVQPEIKEKEVKEKSIKEEVKKEKTVEKVPVKEKEVQKKNEKPQEVKKEKKNDIKKAIANEKSIQKKEEMLPNVSEIFSHRGENIEISFNHNGWIFSGYIHETDAQGVKYVSKDTTYQDCIFTFKSMKTGDFDLEFILQDHSKGSQEKEIVRVHVLADDEFIPDNYDNFVTTSTNAAELSDRGDYNQALKEYLAIYDPASPELNENIAGLYEKLGETEASIPYLEQNFKRDDEYSLPAAEKLFSYSLRKKNPESVTYLSYLLDKGKTCPLQDILDMADMLEQKNDYDHAIDVLGRYLTSYNKGEMLDGIYYRLAFLYEKDTVIRDLKQAKYYYEKVVSEFPSGDFSRPAQKRLKYLNRHFFYIH
ncbi:MAG: hypothetical protein JXJ04_20890 [Spirochaetales bacterium]|nr:hypothetical protein [Spirochaetales bacterium]